MPTKRVRAECTVCGRSITLASHGAVQSDEVDLLKFIQAHRPCQQQSGNRQAIALRTEDDSP